MQNFMHFDCEKLLVARNRTRGDLIDPWGLKMQKARGEVKI